MGRILEAAKFTVTVCLNPLKRDYGQDTDDDREAEAVICLNPLKRDYGQDTPVEHLPHLRPGSQSAEARLWAGY